MTAPVVDRPGLERLLHRASAELGRAGVQPGDRVATCGTNSVETFALSWALTLAGVVEVTLPAGAAPAELRDLLAVGRPVAALRTGPVSRAVVTAVADAGTRTVALDLPGPGPAATPAAAAPRTRPLGFTSGTTGRRKAVTVGVHDDDWGTAWLADEAAAFDQRHGQRHLVVSPLYHSGPFRHALATAHAGGTITVLPMFDVDLWRATLRAWRPTSMFCVPTHLHRLLADRATTAEDLASLRLLVHAGAPCPVRLKHRLHELAPAGAVWEFYGSTEGQFTVCPPDVWASAPGTVGHARPGRNLSVRDADGRSLPVGDTGVVWTTAPPHAAWRYLDDDPATTTAWDADAFTVGDLGHLDADGRLVLDGRPGDLVVTGGVNVYPAEVERVLLGVPGVGEVAVFGVPDEEWGQRVVAAVTPAPGAAPPEAAAVLAAVRDQLAPARRPRELVVVDELPRTPTGKLLRAALPGLVPS